MKICSWSTDFSSLSSLKCSLGVSACVRDWNSGSKEKVWRRSEWSVGYSVWAEGKAAPGGLFQNRRWGWGLDLEETKERWRSTLGSLFPWLEFYCNFFKTVDHTWQYLSQNHYCTCLSNLFWHSCSSNTFSHLPSYNFIIKHIFLM